MLDRQRAYEECKQSRTTVIQERRQLAERQELNLKAEADAKLDGQGDLDAEGEQRLRDTAKSINSRIMQDQLLRDNSGTKEAKLEEQYHRLRLASHNPQDIETPQDMMVAMLSIKERAEETEEQVEAVRERSESLALEHSRLEAELQRVMFFGSSSQALAEAERGMEPAIDQAEIARNKFRNKYDAVKRLTTEAKLGVSLLVNLCAPPDEPYRSAISDAEVSGSFDRVERYLLTCLSHIQMHEQETVSAARKREEQEEAASALAARREEEAAARRAEKEGEGEGEGEDGDKGEDAADGPTEDRPAQPAAADSRSPRGKAKDSDADAAASPRTADNFNIRVLTFEEHEALLELAPSDDGDNDEDDPTLQLTRRRSCKKEPIERQKKAPPKPKRPSPKLDLGPESTAPAQKA